MPVNRVAFSHSIDSDCQLDVFVMKFFKDASLLRLNFSKAD